ncbi:MAG TPA: urease accessory UreF family protein [Chthoniobacteraceae bacterium]
MEGSAIQRPSGEFGWLPFLLQTADALFPTGAYAHSLGFEETVRLSGLRDETGLQSFLLQQILPAQAELELPYLRFAAEARDVEELCAIDQEISAWKLARETREASAQLGGRRLQALRVATDAPELAELGSAIKAGAASGHHLVICGIQARIAGIPIDAALNAYFYQSLSAVCSAALKLIRIGQEGCQRALRAACLQTPETIARSREVVRAEAGWFNPLLEIASMRHARAEERLFIS